jgi:monovalent cation/hydrogen antiporter
MELTIIAIAGLAALLVLLTTICSGLLFNTLIPGLGLASAFALGAIISPTDAVAATSVGRRLGLPSRLLTILEGEGLVNDASSLVLLSSAVAATAATVHLWKVGVDFLYEVVVAVAVGLVVGYADVRIRALLKDPVPSTAVSFVIPFLAWVPAEELGASGILAEVVTGLVTGHQSPRFLSARDRLAERVNWETVAFLLESGIFLLMGLQLRTLVDEDAAAQRSVGEAVWIGLVASVLVVVLRMVFVAPARRHPALRRRPGGLRSAGSGEAARSGQQPQACRQADAADRAADRPQERRRRLLRGRELRLARRDRAGLGRNARSGDGRGRPVAAHQHSVPATARAHRVRGGRDHAADAGPDLPRVILALKVPGDDVAADRADYGNLTAELSAKAAAVLDDPPCPGLTGGLTPPLCSTGCATTCWSRPPSPIPRPRHGRLSRAIPRARIEGLGRRTRRIARGPLCRFVYLAHPHPGPARPRPSGGRLPAVPGSRGSQLGTRPAHV